MKRHGKQSKMGGEIKEQIKQLMTTGRVKFTGALANEIMQTIFACYHQNIMPKHYKIAKELNESTP
jgi:hypothetical protein